jgi:hypothetical protein
MRETLPHSLVDLKLTESVLSAVVKTHFTIFAVPFIHSFRFFFFLRRRRYIARGVRAVAQFRLLLPSRVGAIGMACVELTFIPLHSFFCFPF